MAENYFTRIVGLQNVGDGNDIAVSERSNSFEAEMEDWWDGNMIFGEGLFYYQRAGYGNVYLVDNLR